MTMRGKRSVIEMLSCKKKFITTNVKSKAYEELFCTKIVKTYIFKADARGGEVDAPTLAFKEKKAFQCKAKKGREVVDQVMAAYYTIRNLHLTNVKTK